VKRPKLVHGHRIKILTFHSFNSVDLFFLQRGIRHLRRGASVYLIDWRW
jgi:hypothetical protein